MNYSFRAYHYIYKGQKAGPKRWLLMLVLMALILLFLPWTQNIRAKGFVTALRQEQRPQTINTIIGGRIEKWFVKEGDQVRKGDTLLQLSEIKADYLDPNLLQRTREQLKAKSASVQYYQNKVMASETQIGALQEALRTKLEQVKTKLEQVRLKATADSMDVQAAHNDLGIAQLQYQRQKMLHDSGLVSVTQLEGRNIAYQNALAKKISAENKYLSTRQELQVINMELNALQQDYLEKQAKAESDKYASLSLIAGSQGEMAKLQNQYASYTIRNGMYYILAPQDGQLVNTRANGIGEILKEGDALAGIVPNQRDYAVELYIRPVDLPLINTGQPVRFIFDGFPAIVFSGWPAASYGTFGGIVSAIESEVSANGKFKVLVKEDPLYRPWPVHLKIGTGANGIALLKEVPAWYELWRNINSFPPDYYVVNKEEKK